MSFISGPSSAIPAVLGASANNNSPEKLKGAAQQFEALMISELLKSARSGSGWLGTGDGDEAGQSSIDLGEQQLATVMSKGGGLGLQNFITQSLVRKP